MGRVLSHVCGGLAVFLGLIPFSAKAQVRYCGLTDTTNLQAALGGANITLEDEGLALKRCLEERDSRAPYARRDSQGRIHLFVAPQGQCVLNSTRTAFQLRFVESGAMTLDAMTCQATTIVGGTATYNLRNYLWSSTCATRPNRDFTTQGINPVFSCKDGCQYDIRGKQCRYFGPQGIYTCAVISNPTGQTCDPEGETGFPVAPRPPEPENPDRDGDGVPNDQDEAPDDPGCSVDCGPQPEQPEEPDPGPEDDLDDGQQVAETLGPKLDNIEKAVLGLGPRIDQVRASVDGARADANTDADRMVSAIDAVAAAVRAQGPNVPGGNPDPGEGEGDGEGPDLSPLTPGPDGGEHPGLSSVVEQGDADQMLAQLDTDGWSLTRSCPAYAWPLSFDLGWGTANITEAVDMVCAALAVLGWVIGLAGLIQASFILSRVGGGS